MSRSKDHGDLFFFVLWPRGENSVHSHHWKIACIYVWIGGWGGGGGGEEGEEEEG